MQKYANVEQTFFTFYSPLLNHFFSCLHEFLPNFTNCCHETWISSGGHSTKGSGCSSKPSSHFQIFGSRTPSFLANVEVFWHSEWHFHYTSWVCAKVLLALLPCRTGILLIYKRWGANLRVQRELLPQQEQFRASCIEKVRQRLWAPSVGRCCINGLACTLRDRNILSASYVLLSKIAYFGFVLWYGFCSQMSC